MGVPGVQAQRPRLPAEHPRPEIPRFAEHIVHDRVDDEPRVYGQLNLELPRVPSGVPGEDAHPLRRCLRIGRIAGVVKRNSGIFQEVVVTPFADFEKLEEVLVVLNTPKQEMGYGQ